MQSKHIGSAAFYHFLRQLENIRREWGICFGRIGRGENGKVSGRWETVAGAYAKMKLITP